MPKHASLMRKSSWSKLQNGAVQVNAFASCACATRFLQLESHRNNPKIPWLMFLYHFTLNMLGNQFYEIPINHLTHHGMAIIFIYIYIYIYCIYLYIWKGWKWMEFAKTPWIPDGLLSAGKSEHRKAMVFFYHQIKRFFPVKMFPIIQFYPCIQITMLRFHGCGSSRLHQDLVENHPMAVGNRGRVEVISRCLLNCMPSVHEKLS